MTTKWYLNTKTKYIGMYEEYQNGNTNFPRGELMAYRDYLVSNFSSKEEAQQSGYMACEKCEDAVKPDHNGVCWRCKGTLT